jgi:hypothetical protein
MDNFRMISLIATYSNCAGDAIRNLATKNSQNAEGQNRVNTALLKKNNLDISIGNDIHVCQTVESKLSTLNIPFLSRLTHAAYVCYFSPRYGHSRSGGR